MLDVFSLDMKFLASCGVTIFHAAMESEKYRSNPA
jgi:hypothetical protein